MQGEDFKLTGIHSFLTETLLRSSKLEKNPEEDEGWKELVGGIKVLQLWTVAAAFNSKRLSDIFFLK